MVQLFEDSWVWGVHWGHPTSVCQSGGDLQHFNGITYFMKFDLPASQVLSLHQVQKLRVEQLLCFSGAVRSRWKQINWIVKRCIVRWQSNGIIQWNIVIRNAEKCRTLWKFKACFTELSDVMNILTSVAPIPYLLNMSTSSGSPGKYHEDKFPGFQHAHIPAPRSIIKEDALKIEFFLHWKCLTLIFILNHTALMFVSVFLGNKSKEKRKKEKVC